MQLNGRRETSVIAAAGFKCNRAGSQSGDFDAFIPASEIHIGSAARNRPFRIGLGGIRRHRDAGNMDTLAHGIGSCGFLAAEGDVEIFHIADDIHHAGTHNAVNGFCINRHTAGAQGGQAAIFVDGCHAAAVYHAPGNVLICGVAGIYVRSHLHGGADGGFIEFIFLHIHLHKFCFRGGALNDDGDFVRDTGIVCLCLHNNNTGCVAEEHTIFIDGGAAGAFVLQNRPDDVTGGFGGGKVDVEADIQTCFDDGDTINRHNFNGLRRQNAGGVIHRAALAGSPVVAADTFVDHAIIGDTHGGLHPSVCAGVSAEVAIVVESLIADGKRIACHMLKVDGFQTVAAAESIVTDGLHGSGNGDLLQCGADVESFSSNCGNTVRNADGNQIAEAVECITADFRNAGGNDYLSNLLIIIIPLFAGNSAGAVNFQLAAFQHHIMGIFAAHIAAQNGIIGANDGALVIGVHSQPLVNRAAEANEFQIRASIEGILTDGGHRCGNGQFSQGSAIIECVGIDGRGSLGDDSVFLHMGVDAQFTAVTQGGCGGVAEFNTTPGSKIFNIHTVQRATIAKGTVSNDLHRSVHRNHAERIAVVESIFADGFHPVAKGNEGQGIAVIEGAFSNRGHSLSHGDLRQVIAVVEAVAADAGYTAVDADAADFAAVLVPRCAVIAGIVRHSACTGDHKLAVSGQHIADILAAAAVAQNDTVGAGNRVDVCIVRSHGQPLLHGTIIGDVQLAAVIKCFFTDGGYRSGNGHGF